MMEKYQQQEEVNQDLMKQIEMLEEQGDTAAFAEEMKRIYADRDSYRGPSANSLSQSDKLLHARKKLAQSAQKFETNKSRRSLKMAQISEELDEDESMAVSHDSSKKSKDLSKTMKENRTGSLANSMKELSTPKLNQTDDFMKQIEDVENELPTMEDLAGTSLVKQIEAQEVKEEARVSNRNRMGASLLA